MSAGSVDERGLTRSMPCCGDVGRVCGEEGTGDVMKGFLAAASSVVGKRQQMANLPDIH